MLSPFVQPQSPSSKLQSGKGDGVVVVGCFVVDVVVGPDVVVVTSARSGVVLQMSL